MVSAPNMCIICKGSRALCGHSACPLLPRFEIAPKLDPGKKELSGPGYPVFVGRMGYPNVMTGPLVAIEDKPLIDSPALWFGQDYSKVIELRSSLLRSKHAENIHSASRFVRDSQEITLASVPTDVEIVFGGRPFFRASFSDVAQPMGPSVAIDKLRIAENPKIPRRIERLVSDELKSSEAGMSMYTRGDDVYRISSILSSGALGLEGRRKLVPTRWGITGTDDMVGKALLGEIRGFQSINEHIVFESEYLGNHFVILMAPGEWEFENFEAWKPGSAWAHGLKRTEIIEEHEPFGGRKSYAELQGGGYYASRLACIEKLKEMRRQARVIAFREISEGYVIPLGVWVVRETARHACRSRPVKFASLQEALSYAGSRLRIPLPQYLKQSRLLCQKRLGDFARP